MYFPWSCPCIFTATCVLTVVFDRLLAVASCNWWISVSLCLLLAVLLLCWKRQLMYVKGALYGMSIQLFSWWNAHLSLTVYCDIVWGLGIALTYSRIILSTLLWVCFHSLCSCLCLLTALGIVQSGLLLEDVPMVPEALKSELWTPYYPQCILYCCLAKCLGEMKFN